MSTYLDLVNLAINESGKEIDELTDTNFDSSFAGQRIYPRFKRAVAEAWKAIQIRRNEWEFSTAELSLTLLPRMVISDVDFSAPSNGPEQDVIYRGNDSGLILTVSSITLLSNPFQNMDENTGVYQVDFTVTDDSPIRATIGETFTEVSPNPGDSTFVYAGRGSYPLSDFSEFAREPHWSQFIAYQDNSNPVPMMYIPWENWAFKELTYSTATRSAPRYVTQDYNGNLQFYPQSLSPFKVNMICDLAPQELTDWDDTPSLKLLPAELHDWIAWEALERIARYDKDPDLLAYAEDNGKPYRRKAERALMPLISFRPSEYNK